MLTDNFYVQSVEVNQVAGALRQGNVGTGLASPSVCCEYVIFLTLLWR